MDSLHWDYDQTLIELVRNRPELYDATQPSNNEDRRKCWEEIAATLANKGDKCKERWESLRSQYRKHLRKARKGKVGARRRQWKHADQLAFLEPFMKKIPDERHGCKEAKTESEASSDDDKGKAFSRQDDALLISAVRGSRDLYDWHSPYYRDLVVKRNTWQDISNRLRRDVVRCKDRWESLRAQYRKHLVKKGEAGDAWRYADELAFLLPFMKERSAVLQRSTATPDSDEDATTTDSEEDATTAKFSRHEDEKLIELVRSMPELYAKGSPQYGDSERSWDVVGGRLGCEGSRCKSRWTSLRKRYRKHLKKKKKGKANIQKWKYEDQLSFLLPFKSKKSRNLDAQTDNSSLTDVSPGSSIANGEELDFNILNTLKQQAQNNKKLQECEEIVVTPDYVAPTQEKRRKEKRKRKVGEEINVVPLDSCDPWHQQIRIKEECQLDDEEINEDKMDSNEIPPKQKRRKAGTKLQPEEEKIVNNSVNTDQPLRQEPENNIKQENIDDVLSHLEDTEINIKPNPEPINAFFSLMAATVKRFNPADQHFIKTQVFSLVSQIESKYIQGTAAQNVTYPPSPVSLVSSDVSLLVTRQELNHL